MQLVLFKWQISFKIYYERKLPVLQVLQVVILLKLNQILLAALKCSKYISIGFLMVRWFENKFKDKRY